MGPNSINSWNNTNWLFTSQPSIIPGIFTINKSTAIINRGLVIIGKSPKGSIYFSGSTSSYLTINNDIDLRFRTGDFTVEWFQYQTDNKSYPRPWSLGYWISAGYNFDNIKIEGFEIKIGDFSGKTHDYYNCNLVDIYDLAGTLTECSLDGRYDNSIRILGDTTFVDCYPYYTEYPPHIELVNPSGTTVSFRRYSGDLIIDNMTSNNDMATIELVGGKVILTTGCTSGIVDIRGVGYLVNESSGTTVITTGLAGEFPLTQQDVETLASLTGLTELLVLTGMTEQLNSIESGVTTTNQNVLMTNENVLLISSGVTTITEMITGITDQLIVIESGITTVNENVLIVNQYVTGITEQLTVIQSGITSIDIPTGITQQLSSIESGITSINETVNEIAPEIKLILGLTQHNYRLSNHVYDSEQRLLSVTMKLFNTKADCDNNVNEFATYQMNASYDGSGLLVDYKVVKV